MSRIDQTFEIEDENSPSIKFIQHPMHGYAR